MRIIAALAIALTAGCAGGPVNWNATGRAWVDSVCRDAQARSDYCAGRGYPAPGLGRY